jgi:hypothetical protein
MVLITSTVRSTSLRPAGGPALLGVISVPYAPPLTEQILSVQPNGRRIDRYHDGLIDDLPAIAGLDHQGRGRERATHLVGDPRVELPAQSRGPRRRDIGRGRADEQLRPARRFSIERQRTYERNHEDSHERMHFG